MPKSVGIQPQDHLQGGKGGGAGKPKGAAHLRQPKPTTRMATEQDRLNKLIEMFGEDHEWVHTQREKVDALRREAEEQMSPPQKAAILRKELSAALDASAEMVFQWHTLKA